MISIIKPWAKGACGRGAVCVGVLGAALLAGCGTPPPPVRVDPDIERQESVARNAYAVGRVEKAALFYRQALDRARLIDDPKAIGRNAYNLAACLAGLNRWDEARALLEEARAEWDRAGIEAREVAVLAAKVAWWQGRPDEALLITLAQLKRLPGTRADPWRIQFQLLLADLVLGQGDLDRAAKEFAAIDSNGVALCDLNVQADFAWFKARLLVRQKKISEGALAADEAARQLQRVDRFSEMAVALDAAGRGYETSGNADKAVDRYYRSARTRYEMGQLALAGEEVARALALSERLALPEAKLRIDRLKSDVEAAIKRQDAGVVNATPSAPLAGTNTSAATAAPTAKSLSPRTRQ